MALSPLSVGRAEPSVSGSVGSGSLMCSDVLFVADRDPQGAGWVTGPRLMVVSGLFKDTT